MALRSLYVVLAFSLVIATGCQRTANYQRPCCPAVVATTPVPAPCPAPCPPGQIPPPPGVLVPR
jgi:hypothetical protein